MNRSTRRIAALVATLLVAPVAAGCGDDAAGGSAGGSGSLSLVAYSTPQEAYEQLIPKFSATAPGKGVKFSKSFGSSGDQARAVIAGLKADVVALSLEPDITKLIDEKLVAGDWNADEHKGIVTDSVVVFMTRKGNPKGLQSWDDLLRDDVEVITPNPVTSGGARWNIMAAYGQATKAGKSDAQALAYVKELLANTAVQDKSARESLQTFDSGKGDVLLGYENEALTAKKKGLEIDYVIPDSTILIENPIAVTTNAKNPEGAQAFLDFLRTPEAQQVFAENGYRPVLKDEVDATRFPTPSGLFTIADLGGWSEVAKRFFDAEQGLVTKINEDLGVKG